MSDDDRLAELFRTAASDPGAPAPGFDHADVVAASRRITVRRRSAAVVAAVLLVLAGVGTVIALPGGPGPDAVVTGVAAAPNEGGANEEGANEEGVVEGGADEGSAPEDASGADAGASGASGAAPGGDTPSSDAQRAAPAPLSLPAAPAPDLGGPTGPLGPGGGGCAERQDPALRALVEQVLPEVVGAPAAPTTDVCLPAGDRYLALEVTDGAAAGVLTVAYLQPGSEASLVAGALSARTASGGTALVVSGLDTTGTAAPFADRLPALLEFLAPRL